MSEVLGRMLASLAEAVGKEELEHLRARVAMLEAIVRSDVVLEQRGLVLARVHFCDLGHQPVPVSFVPDSNFPILLTAELPPNFNPPELGPRIWTPDREGP